MLTKKQIKEEILKTIRMRPTDDLFVHRIMPQGRFAIFTDRVVFEEDYAKFSTEEKTNYFLGKVRTVRTKQEILFFLPIGELVAVGKGYCIFPPVGKIKVQIKLN